MPLGNLDMLKEKINSIPGHLSNKHVFQSNSHHKCCSHGDLGGTRSKAWLDPDSKVRFTLVLLCSIKCFVVMMIFNVPNLAYQSLLSHRLLQKSGLLWMVIRGIGWRILRWCCSLPTLGTWVIIFIYAFVKISMPNFSENFHSLLNKYCSKQFFYT